MLYALFFESNSNDFLKMSWSAFSVGRMANIYGLKQTRFFSYIVMLPGLLFELR